MLPWVYIFEDNQGILKTGLSSGFGESRSGIKEDENIVYMHPFGKPFDAAAHKILLEFLSLESIQFIINKQKAKTNLFLSSVSFCS